MAKQRRRAPQRANPPPRARPTVERKIYFYRVDCGADAGGRPLPFDPNPACQHVNGLAFDNAGRYMASQDGESTCCWIDRLQAPLRLRLGTIRRGALPQVEAGGNLTDLPIPAGSGLAEQIHVIFFPDNIVGAEFNFYGPRLSRLATYFLSKAQNHCPLISFQALLRQDVLQQLNRLNDIRLFDLKMRASYAATVEQADHDLGSAFRAQATAAQADEIEVILRRDRRSQQPLAARLLQLAKTLAGRQDVHTEASRFIVKGTNRETDRMDAVDVLSDNLISKKQIILEGDRTRALDPASAFAAIEQAHGELGDQIAAAAGVAQ